MVHGISLGFPVVITSFVEQKSGEARYNIITAWRTPLVGYFLDEAGGSVYKFAHYCKWTALAAYIGMSVAL